MVVRSWLAAGLALLMSSAASAQVVECPGSVPVMQMSKERAAATAERLLDRFVGALGLRGVKAVDQAAVLKAYGELPEQLLVKLQYLALQCGMLVLSGPSELAERQAIIRRVFLDYALSPPATGNVDLASYLNQTASAGTGIPKDPKLAQLVKAAEQQQQQLPSAAWHTAWFRPAGALQDDPNRWAVIVASPETENEGWTMLREHQARWPKVHFELHAPYDPDSPTYALVVGRRLPEGDARSLLESVKRDGLAPDSFVWQLPPGEDVGQIARAQP